MDGKSLERYKQIWNAQPWHKKLYGAIYHKIVLNVFIYTGWLPEWMRALFKGLLP